MRLLVHIHVLLKTFSLSDFQSSNSVRKLCSVECLFGDRPFSVSNQQVAAVVHPYRRSRAQRTARPPGSSRHVVALVVVALQ